MRNSKLSPLTSTLVAIALVIGILVADLTNVRSVTVAGAQDGQAVAEGTIVGRRIGATDVLVNGVAASGVFVGSVRIVDSMVIEDGGTAVDSGGVYPGDTYTLDTGGVYPGDTYTLGGVYPGDTYALEAGGVYPGDSRESGGVYPGDQKPVGVYTNMRITGGVVEGDDVRVVHGRIVGSNLRVVSAVVRSAHGKKVK